MTFVPKLKDFAHQTRAKDKARGKSAFAYLLEMGTGKSKTAIDELCELASEGVVNRVLVLAGKGSYADWVNEHLPTHWRSDVQAYIAHLWEGADKREVRKMDLFMSCPGAPVVKILVMNLEALSASEKAQKFAKAFVEGGRAAMVIDEASKIKNRKSVRSIVLCRMAKKAVIRRILTGSPVTQSPMDLWSQVQFLGPNLLPFSNYASFQATFCNTKIVYLGKRKVEKIESYKNLSKLTSLIEPFSYRVMKSECLDLPPKIYQRYQVELTGEQHRLYEDMKRFSVAELREGGGFVSATLAISRLSKLHQIVCGHVVNEDGVSVQIPSNRVQAMMDVLEEGAGPAIIWCAFRHDVAAAVSALRTAYGSARIAEYHGGVNSQDRARAILGVQIGDIDWFVATQATGGYGITLTASHRTCYYSNNFNLEHRLQSEDRQHRIGQLNPVSYTDLCAPNTVDEKLIQALREKKDIAHEVMGDGIQEWLK